jgi:hypothetical protein
MPVLIPLNNIFAATAKRIGINLFSGLERDLYNTNNVTQNSPNIKAYSADLYPRAVWKNPYSWKLGKGGGATVSVSIRISIAESFFTNDKPQKSYVEKLDYVGELGNSLYMQLKHAQINGFAVGDNADIMPDKYEYTNTVYWECLVKFTATYTHCYNNTTAPQKDTALPVNYAPLNTFADLPEDKDILNPKNY